jgi:murein DD-endopeptidase MepM/ murein hydrolase activator NlpD
MANKTFVRVVAIVMALIMALSVLYIVVSSVSAQAVVTQKQIDDMKKQQKENEKRAQEIQAQINSLQYQQTSALEKKQVLDTQIQLTQSEIDNISDQIAAYDELIAQKTTEVQEAQINEDLQWAKYKANMRAMEENGAISYISVIFKANSFSELLANINDVGEIMQAEQRLYQQLKAAKQATIDAKTSLQAAKQDQEADRVDMEQKKGELQKQLDNSVDLLNKLNDDISAAKELYEQEKKEAEKIQSDINKKVEELRKQNQAKGGAVKGTGKFIWPTPSCTKVTSKFGMRFHPIYHEYRMHTGIDIGASYGSNIDAADDGTVIISTYSSSYGHYVVIDHGNGYTTLYAHMSQRLVKAGDKVKQNQVIGKVGSTGNSTGPHLHFEISKQGTRINPLQFYSNYTIVS